MRRAVLTMSGGRGGVRDGRWQPAALGGLSAGGDYPSAAFAYWAEDADAAANRGGPLSAEPGRPARPAPLLLWLHGEASHRR